MAAVMENSSLEYICRSSQSKVLSPEVIYGNNIQSSDHLDHLGFEPLISKYSSVSSLCITFCWSITVPREAGCIPFWESLKFMVIYTYLCISSQIILGRTDKIYNYSFTVFLHFILLHRTVKSESPASVTLCIFQR